MQLLKMRPYPIKNIWGGTKLSELYRKQSELDIIAESLEVCALEDFPSVVEGGDYDGYTIADLIKRLGKDFCGATIDPSAPFPLLFKLLDAQKNLSVQVHPDNYYAYHNEQNKAGKTEAWYILEADKDAYIIYGLKEGVTKDRLKLAIKDNTLASILNRVPCKKGDVFFIPSGTVHAACAGLVIAEIQQTSDLTYRLYDYDRLDKDGKKRELHIQKALDVISFPNTPSQINKIVSTIGDTTISKMIDCEYFHLEQLDIKSGYCYNTQNILNILFITQGEFVINCRSYTKGDTIITPGAVDTVNIKGQGIILKYHCP